MENNLKVLFWDLDDTLIDLYASIEYSLKKCFKTLNIEKYNDEILKDYTGFNIKYWALLEKGEVTFSEVFVKRFEDLFKKHNINADPFKAGELYEKYTYERVLVYEDMIDIVKKCQGKYKQYITTNGDHDIQRGKILKTGYINLFDGIFISGDIGFVKPQKEYFEKIFNFIGDYKRDEIMIIGDSQTSDMLGGNNAKIKCCYLNWYGREIDEGLKLDYNISSSKELEEILLK